MEKQSDNKKPEWRQILITMYPCISNEKIDNAIENEKYQTEAEKTAFQAGVIFAKYESGIDYKDSQDNPFTLRGWKPKEPHFKD